jgi:hypothetical protein
LHLAAALLAFSNDHIEIMTGADIDAGKSHKHNACFDDVITCERYQIALVDPMLASTSTRGRKS